MNNEKILVLDFGGQYNQLIARRVRECNVYCEIYSYKTDIEKIKAMNPKGIILTGGPNSCYEDGAPTYKKELFDAVREFVRYNMIVDIYNTPLCLVDNRIKGFCRDSISTWKKIYLKQCDGCKEKETCSGVFETSFKHSDNINPIL